MFERESQPRRHPDGAVSRAGEIPLLLLLAATGLLTACCSCAPTVDSGEDPPAAPAAASRDRTPRPNGLDDTLPGPATLTDSGPSFSIEAVPTPGGESPLVVRGFDARARQSRKSPQSLMQEFEEQSASGRYPEALQTLETVLRDRPDDPGLLYLMAVTHRAAEHSNLAVPVLERVIAIDPTHINARKLLCVIWTEEGRYTAAEAQIDALVAAGTADAEAWALRGAARLNSGDLQNAGLDAEQSLQMDPQMYKAFIVRCAVRLGQGQLDAARDDLVAAREAGAPERTWQTLSRELGRRVTEQQRASGAPTSQ